MRAHTIGLVQGAVPFGVAGSWHLFRASPRVLAAIRLTLLAGFYANWTGAQLAALWSTARHMFIPQHAERMPAGASAWMDAMVTALFIVSMLVLLPSLLMLWGSRRRSGP